MAKNSKKPIREVPCYFRADRGLLDEIDAFAKREERPRSQMIVRLIRAGIVAIEEKYDAHA